MYLLFTIILWFISLFIFNYCFKKWINPVSIYGSIWVAMILFYEMRLMAYTTLSNETWIVILSTYILLMFGSITIFTARSLYKPFKQEEIEKTSVISPLFNNEAKLLVRLILILSSLGLISTAHHWYNLLQEFGSITNVLIQAAVIYQMRVEGDIGTGIPYIFAGVHMALFLTGIYSAYKNKFNFLILIPFLILILKSLAEVSRAGLLLGLFEFIIGFVFYKQYLSTIKPTEKKSNKKIIFGLIIILTMVIAGATAVKVFRAPYESYKASSSSLNKFEKGVFFSPTIYLYLSSHIGVLNNYLQKQDENNYFGEVTFFPFYRLISKFEVIDEPRYYQKGYFIPMWSNTGTYLRDLHADFGYTGLFLIPYLLGMISTFYWIRFYEKQNFIDFVILCFVTIILAYSFLLMATRFGNWLISLIGFLVIIPILENRYKKQGYLSV